MYQQFVLLLITTFLVKNFTTLLVLKNYYISGFYYYSGSKVTTFLGFTTILVQKLLRFWLYYTFWLFTKFLGLTSVLIRSTVLKWFPLESDMYSETVSANPLLKVWQNNEIHFANYCTIVAISIERVNFCVEVRVLLLRSVWNLCPPPPKKKIIKKYQCSGQRSEKSLVGSGSRSQNWSKNTFVPPFWKYLL